MKLHPLAVAIAFLISTTSTAAGQATNNERKLPGQVIPVEAGEFFIKAADTVAAGLTTFVLRQVGDALTNREKTLAENLAPASAQNDPTRAFHMLWVVRLDSGHTVAEWYGSYLKGERKPWAENLGGPSFADPPLTSNATMILEPGNYVLVCYVGSAREDKNRHHVLKGMFKGLTVRTASSLAQSLPAGDVTATITGTGQVTLAGTLRAGAQTIRVTNQTDKEHEFTVQRVKPGRTAVEAITWRRRDGTTHPFEPAGGGFSDVPPGASRLTTITFEPGAYVLWTIRSPQTSVAVTIPAK